MSEKSTKYSLQMFLQNKYIPVSIIKLFDRLLKIDKFNNVIEDFTKLSTMEEFFDYCDKRFKIRSNFYDMTNSVEQLPKTGPAIIISNHPTGIPECILMLNLLFKVRQDFKIVANNFLNHIEITQDLIIPVELYAQEHDNFVKIRQMVNWLKSGKALVIFPAGEASSMQVSKGKIADNIWHRLPLVLSRRTKAPIIPIHITARNSAIFYLLGIVNPLFRSAMMVRELMNKKNKLYKFAIGNEIPSSYIDKFSGDSAIDNLYSLTYCLPYKTKYESRVRNAVTKDINYNCKLPVTMISNIDKVKKELELLRAEHLMSTTGNFELFLAPGEKLDLILQEIGLQRERAFRRINMGTGNELDLDPLDQSAEHLFLWDLKNEKLAGAYRFNLITDVNSPSYLEELYSINMPKILEQGVICEFSRAFLTPEYQGRCFMLLWKGMMKFIAEHKELKYISGLPSISVDFADPKIFDILAYYVYKNASKVSVGKYFSAFYPYYFSHKLPRSLKDFINTCNSWSQIELLISNIIGKNFEFPLLFKHYESMGAYPVAVSVDPGFNDCIDVLTILELDNINTKKFKFYARGSS